MQRRSICAELTITIGTAAARSLRVEAYDLGVILNGSTLGSLYMRSIRSKQASAFSSASSSSIAAPYSAMPTT